MADMPETYEQRDARIRRWRHGSFLYCVEVARTNMGEIATASTTTPETKQLASEIRPQLEELLGLLSKRNDQ